MNRIANLSIALLLAVLPSPSTASGRVELFWQRVRLDLNLRGVGSVSLRGAMTVQSDNTFLRKVELRVAGKKVSCSEDFYRDLPFPQIQSLSLVYGGDPFSTSGPLWIRFKFGQEPTFVTPTLTDYPQVDIEIRGFRCVGREFRVPQRDGSYQAQKQKP